MQNKDVKNNSASKKGISSEKQNDLSMLSFSKEDGKVALMDSLIKDAKEYVKNEKYSKAIVSYKLSASIAVSQNDLQRYVNCVSNISDCFEMLLDRKNAIEEQEDALGYLESVSADNDLRAECIINLIRLRGELIDNSLIIVDDSFQNATILKDMSEDCEKYLMKFNELSTCSQCHDETQFIHLFEKLLESLEEDVYNVKKTTEGVLDLVKNARVLFGKLGPKNSLTKYLKERQDEFSFSLESLKGNKDFFLKILDNEDNQFMRQRAGRGLAEIYKDEENFSAAEGVYLDLKDSLEARYQEKGFDDDTFRAFVDQCIDSAFFYLYDLEDKKMAKFFLKRFEKITDLAKKDGFLETSMEDIAVDNEEAIEDLYNEIPYAFSGYLSLKREIAQQENDEATATSIGEIIFLIDLAEKLQE